MADEVESGDFSVSDESQSSAPLNDAPLPPPPTSPAVSQNPPPPVPPVGTGSDAVGTGNSRKSLAVILVVVAIGLLFVVGAGGAAAYFLMSGESGHKLGGTMTLIDSGFSSGKICSGDGGYSDIDFGANVTVYDGSGKILATGILGIGIGSSYSRCVFPVEIDKKIPTKDFYAVEVTHRGKVSYSKSQLEAQNWEVSLTLGD